MTPQRWQRLKDVYFGAADLSGEARQGYLSQMCASDPELRAEVDSLLVASASENVVLDQSASKFLSPDAFEVLEDPWIGRELGAYRLIARLGRGGMGDVYRAQRADAQYEMEVAVKVVRTGVGADLARRFTSERQILARLDHPGIARLLDGGVASTGEPYLVMELVQGEPVDVYCGTRKLPIRDRLHLFRQVCAAVSYAHQRLVVHRDLKPANILVNSDGAVKLLDFGIAKLLHAETGDEPAENITRTAWRAMTPEYSSPEQVLGLPITTASDVYSLGVVLFHLLTGRGPYRGTAASAHEALRDVCEMEPIKPSVAAAQTAEHGWSGALPDRDLDHITLRALRKEPENRYGSVEQFSEDLRRYLAGLPVIASGDQFAYRVKKFWGRHRLGVAMTALAFIALIAALAITLREARVAAQQSALAAQHFASVRRLANTFMFQVDDAIKNLPGAADARSLLASTAQTYLDTLAKQASTDRGLQLDLAESYARLADIQGEPNRQNTGQVETALTTYAKALALFQSTAGAEPADAAVLSKMAVIHKKRGRMLLMVNGDADAGANESQKAVDLLSSIVTMKPADIEAKEALASAYVSHSDIESYAGNYDDGVAASDRAVEIMEELHRLRPADNKIAALLAHAYSSGIVIPQRAPDSAQIERGLDRARKALPLDQHVLDTDPSPSVSKWRSVAADWATIGNMLALGRDFEASVANYRLAEMTLQKIPADPDNVQGQVDWARIRVNLGREQVEAGHLDEAHEILSRNVSLLESILRTDGAKEIQYLLAETEEELGSIEMKWAQKAGAPGRELQHWRVAMSWFARSDPRFKRIISGVKLNYWDQQPVDRAAEGFARSRTEIGRLEAQNTTG